MLTNTDIAQLTALLNSRVRMLTIDSLEEGRIVETFLSLGFRTNRPVFTWTVTKGLHRRDGSYSPQLHTREPSAAIGQIRGTDTPAFYLLLDFEPYFDDVINRHLRDIAQGDNGHVLVFVGADLQMPKVLEPMASEFRLALPTDKVLHQIVREEAWRYRDRYGKSVQTRREYVDKLVQNLRGLTAADARRLAHRVLFDDGTLNAKDLAQVAQAKFKLLNLQGSLDLTFETQRFDTVGGLRNLKRWLEVRRDAFLGDHDGDRPKGMLLVGVQGCGKSLAAKSVAGTWGVPLLSFDIGKLYNKYHGETERNLRRALETATKMAPCVLWIDEIEKGLAVSDSDSGTSQRVLGTLLTWMNEDKGAVFLVATANAIDQLPPELIRKGRVDELFFVDLPGEDVRKTILEIHLKSRNVRVSDEAIERLARASEGFSGSELEQAVISALYVAKSENTRLHGQHILDEITRTQPLSVVMSERIDALRDWARGRTVPVD